MKSLTSLLNSLEQSPNILHELLTEIPANILKTRPNRTQWSIHEHICHIAVGDKFGFHKRILSFQQNTHPIFKPLSGTNFSPDYFLEMDIQQALQEFTSLRKKTISFAKNLDPNLWHKEGSHPEYSKYTPYIMLRHLLLHDYTHMYTIEDLWLNKNLTPIS